MGTCGLGLVTQMRNTGGCLGCNLAMVGERRKHGQFPQGILQRDSGALVWVGREGLGLAPGAGNGVGSFCL